MFIVTEYAALNADLSLNFIFVTFDLNPLKLNNSSENNIECLFNNIILNTFNII